MNLMKKTITAMALVLFAMAAFAAKDTVEARIKPVGDVCMAGDPCAAAAVVANAEPRTGESIYSSKCATCHASGVAGAPKMGDIADWKLRVTARTLVGLYKGAWAGYNAMPAKGLCMDCSEDEIKAAVDHILAKSQ